MPEPSTELTLIGAMLRAHLASLPPRKRKVFLSNLHEVFEEYEETANVVRIRGREHDEAVTRSRKGAIAWTRGMMAAFFMADVARR